MELLQGESLAARIAGGPMAVAEAVSIALGMLGGHRGAAPPGSRSTAISKPSNIFLTPHGVKLLDFGLTTVSAALTDETACPPDHAGHGHRARRSTPRRSSCAGKRVDARTDLFAAGAVLYEMLAGKPPFPGKSAVEVFHAIMYDQPPVLTGGPAVAALDRVVHPRARETAARAVPDG